MQFRLRTLMIVISALSLYFAWAGYSFRRAQFHRKKAADAISRIAIADQKDDRLVSEMVAFTSGVSHKSPTGFYFGTRAENEWQEASRHLQLAARYERAIYQPWRGLSSATRR